MILDQLTILKFSKMSAKSFLLLYNLLKQEFL